MLKLGYLDTVGRYSSKINHEWPSQQQVDNLPDEKFIKLARIRYRFSEDALSAIQLLFTNGIESPVFDTEVSEEKPMQFVEVEVLERVAEVYYYVLEDRIQEIKLADENGKVFASVSGNIDISKSDKITQKIPAGMEIIGAYCSL